MSKTLRLIAYILGTLSFLGLSGCSQESEQPVVRAISTLDDPLVLPYRFVVDQKRSSRGPTYIHPIDFEGDGYWESYHVQQGRDGAEDMASIVLYSCLFCGNVIQQYNFDHAHFAVHSTNVADLDGDGLPDIVAAYTARDSAWLEVLQSSDGRQDPLLLCAGSDGRGDGSWDGEVFLTAIDDVNHDGIPEIFMVIDSGHDLYPRRLICVDWKIRKILWHYEVAGLISYRHTRIVPSSSGDGSLIVIGISSKDNAAKTPMMDDQHSYLVILNDQGTEQWRRLTGGKYTNPTPILVDYDQDGDLDVLFTVLEDSTTSSGREAIDREVSAAFVICDLAGSTIDSIPVTGTERIRDLTVHPEGFSSDTVVSFWRSDDTLRIVSPSLEPIAKCVNPGGINLEAFGDFLGDGTRQAVVRTPDQRIHLLDGQLNVLAQTGEPVLAKNPTVLPPTVANGPARLLLGSKSRDGYVNYVFRIARTPWYAIFSRKPWLASLAAFAPPAIVLAFLTVIMVQRKRKNAIIASQRDELKVALTELKEAQAKLVVAEKMQQARDIAGGVAHEIHNALYPAIASLDTLKRELNRPTVDNEETLQELIGLCEKAVVRANGMTELVREFTRVDADRSDDIVDLSEVLGEIIASMAIRIDETQSRVTANIAAGLLLRCRRDHAYSLFANLVGNAIDALIDAPKREVSIRAQLRNSHVVINVSDTGPGIPEKDWERVFNAFYSTKPATGTGLGLTLARRIAEVYGGALRIVSSTSEGTCFKLTMPAGHTGPSIPENPPHA